MTLKHLNGCYYCLCYTREHSRMVPDGSVNSINCVLVCSTSVETMQFIKCMGSSCQSAGQSLLAHDQLVLALLHDQHSGLFRHMDAKSQWGRSQYQTAELSGCLGPC